MAWKRAYTLRNDSFHARRISAPMLLQRARRSIPELEALLPSAWARFLGLAERTKDFPVASVVPHDTGMFFDAVLLHQDEKQWDLQNHPHFVGTIDPVRKSTDDPRQVSADYPTNFQVRNVTEETSTELTPSGLPERELALDLAERLDVIVSEAETLTRGRIFGPTLPHRLRTSIETILKCAEWNVRVAAALEQAWAEEREKQGR